MATQLGFSEFNNNENINNIERQNKRKNKTLKKKSKPPSKKVTQFLNSMQLEADDEDDNEDMGDFNPPSPPELTSMPVDKEENNIQPNASENNYRNYNNLEDQLKENFNNYVPYFTDANKGLNPPDNKLMEKLNYMIHLLEESKDEKTDTVTEELILYMFLGVFVIYIVDSFARVGKYTR